MSAFQRERPQPLMAGTKPSLQNGQLRASTGNASVDAILSGGLPVGALWLLEEDRYATYSRALQRYFLGEGAVHGHRLFVATLDEDAREFITKIPQPCDEQTPSSVAGKQRPQPTDTPPVIGAAAAAVADDLRIAWRYNGLPQVDAEQRSAVGATHSFDLTANIDAAELAALTVRTFSQTEADSDDGDAAGRTDGFRNPVYGRLLRAIGDELAAQQRQQQLDGVGRLLRICIAGLGGPLWYGAEMSADVCRFLVVLRALLRRSPAVCCLSMPAHLFAYHDDRLIERVRHSVDCSLQLESFAGSERETNPVFAEYHGLLHIRRLAALNTLAAGTPATHDLAFRLRRRQFVVEKLHLPPELPETSAGSAAAATASVGCGSGGGGTSMLDF